MDRLVNVFLIVGILTFITQALLKVLSDDSSLSGTSTWKWKNIFSIVAGLCLFVLLGLVSFWRFFQGQDPGGFIAGMAMLFAGISLIWISISELLQLNPGPRWANYLLLGSGILLVLWMGYDLWFSYIESSQLSIENLVLIAVGLFAVMTGIKRIKSFSDEMQLS